MKQKIVCGWFSDCAGCVPFLTCGEEAEFDGSCAIEGPVCEHHKCRHSERLTEAPHAIR